MIEGIKIDEDVWEEIGLGDFRMKRGDVIIIDDDHGSIYYKKKVKVEPKFPKNFKNKDYKITCNDYGIEITRKSGSDNVFTFYEENNKNLLEKAIKYWRENK